MLNLRNRSFLKEIDFAPRELRHLLQLAEALKTAKYAGTEARRLDGKEIALIFEKTSTRTRSAFEVAAFDQGAHVTYLDPSGSQLGHKESVADTARVLGRMYDAIECVATSVTDGEVVPCRGQPGIWRERRADPHPMRGPPAAGWSQARSRWTTMAASPGPRNRSPWQTRSNRRHGRVTSSPTSSSTSSSRCRTSTRCPA